MSPEPALRWYFYLGDALLQGRREFDPNKQKNQHHTYISNVTTGTHQALYQVSYLPYKLIWYYASA